MDGTIDLAIGCDGDNSLRILLGTGVSEWRVEGSVSVDVQLQAVASSSKQ